jgi:hypothetical protein
VAEVCEGLSRNVVVQGTGMQSVPALVPQPPKNWSGVVASRPQCVQLQLFPSASVPVAVHTRIGEAPQLALPMVVETKQADGPLPPQFRASFVQ